MNGDVTLLIKDYVMNYKKLKGTESHWRESIIGIASADDPMFLEFKNLISPSHALPSDFISDAKSIIVFFLPFSEEIVRSNIGNAQSSRE